MDRHTWQLFLDANRDAMERYLAQQAALVDLAVRHSPEAQRESIVRLALQANQQVLSDMLGANESTLRTYLSAAGADRDAAVAVDPPPSAAPRSTFAARVETALRERIARVTGFAAHAIDPAATFAELGLDSLSMVDIWSEVLTELPQLEPHSELAYKIRRLGDVAARLAAIETGPSANAPAHPVPASPPGLVERLRQAIAAATHVDVSTVSSDADFELDLNLDVFTRERLLHECLAGHPGLPQVGSELLNARSISDVEALLMRFEPQRSGV